MYFNNLQDNFIKLMLPYTVITYGDTTMIAGKPTKSKIEVEGVMLFVNTAKKEDVDFVNAIGYDEKNIIKIRILKSESYMFKKHDEITYNGKQYKVIKEKAYQDNISNFRIFYAITTEGDKWSY